MCGDTMGTEPPHGFGALGCWHQSPALEGGAGTQGLSGDNEGQGVHEAIMGRARACTGMCGSKGISSPWPWHPMAPKKGRGATCVTRTSDRHQCASQHAPVPCWPFRGHWGCVERGDGVHKVKGGPQIERSGTQNH